MEKKSSKDTNLYFGGVPTISLVHKKALIFSLTDGIFANIMITLTETFGVAAAVFLKAPAIAIAILGSFPLFLSSLGQLLIPFFIRAQNGRKKYVLRGTTLQSFFLFVIALSGYLPEKIRPWFYVFTFALYGFSGNITSGFWMAWMGELVPPEVRGRHFAWRNRIFSITQLITSILAGLISRKYTTSNAEWFLFVIIFWIAGLSRAISTFFLYKQYEPPITISTVKTPENNSYFKLNRSFLYYAISAALVQGSVALAGPFFNVWYVRDLHFNYLTLSSVTAVTVLGTIVSLPLWGKIADTFGNRTVIKITAFLIATIPLPYLSCDKPLQILFLNFYTGFCWSGYNLSNFNYLLLAAGKEKSEQNISFAIALSGFSVFIFSLIGGYLATRLPIVFKYRLSSLFLLSSLMRFIIFFFLILRYPKYEIVPKKSIELLFYIPGYRAGLGLLRNTFRAFRAR